jgi:hypothetical protein
MTIKQVHRFERIVVEKLNKQGWNLKWTGGKYEHYDAKGFTKKYKKCVIEMKFRKDYYEEKLLEKFKYDKLMALEKDIIKIYLVCDPKAMYFFWLDNINLTDVKYIDCPQTTLWETKMEKKEVYLLNENTATYIEKDFNFNSLI